MLLLEQAAFFIVKISTPYLGAGNEMAIVLKITVNRKIPIDPLKETVKRQTQLSMDSQKFMLQSSLGKHADQRHVI